MLHLLVRGIYRDGAGVLGWQYDLTSGSAENTANKGPGCAFAVSDEPEVGRIARKRQRALTSYRTKKRAGTTNGNCVFSLVTLLRTMAAATPSLRSHYLCSYLAPWGAVFDCRMLSVKEDNLGSAAPADSI
jgi:hypothetical protein